MVKKSQETPKMGDSAPTSRSSDTRERILSAAESLFAERGIDGVSLREITTAAAANSAAAHYYFGSKEELLDELFTPRARAIANRRLALLGEVQRNENGHPTLDAVLRAFLLPGLEVTQSAGGESFLRLRARLAFEPAELRQAVLSRAFDQSSKAFVEVLKEALPDVSPNDVTWRFHFILGAMLYTMAASGRIEAITGGALNTSNTAEALEQLVRFASFGLRAPSVSGALRCASPTAP